MKDAHLTELELASKITYQGKFLPVREDRILLPNGKEGLREYIVHPGAVLIVAQLSNGKFLFERQFRYPLRQVFIELPAGKVDAGEDLLECAKRELREETGYSASDWQLLGKIHPCIGYSDECITIFQANGLSREGNQTLDDQEFIEIIELDAAEVDALIREGEITDGKTLSAWLLAGQKSGAQGLKDHAYTNSR